MARSIEELAQIQKLHESAVEAERQRKEAEEKAELERRNKALERLNERLNLSRELNFAQKELDAIESTNFQQRIAISDQTKGDVQNKDAELKVIVAEIEESKERIEGIKKLVEGKKDVSPIIKEELSEAEKNDKVLKEEESELSKILEQLKSKIVPDEEITNYQNLVEKIFILNTDLKEIENDPYVNDFLNEEVKIKTETIEKIINAYLENNSKSDKNLSFSAESIQFEESRNDFIKKVTTQFVKEEIESRQFDIIKDREKRLNAIKKLDKYLLLGLENDDMKNVQFEKNDGYEEKSLVYAGMALAIITGKSKAKKGIIKAMELEIGDDAKNLKTEKIYELDAINIHYRTLNILAAYHSELGKNIHGNKIMGYAHEFDPKMIKSKFDDISVEADGMILPNGISKAEKSETRKIYEESREIAFQEKENIVEKVTKEKQDELNLLNKELANLKASADDIKKLEEEIKAKKITDFAQEEEKIKNIVSNKVERLNLAKVEYDNTILLNISKRNALSAEIKDLEDFIDNLNSTVKDIRGRREKYISVSENLKKLKNKFGSPEEIENKIKITEELIRKISPRQ